MDVLSAFDNGKSLHCDLLLLEALIIDKQAAVLDRFPRQGKSFDQQNFEVEGLDNDAFHSWITK